MVHTQSSDAPTVAPEVGTPQAAWIEQLSTPLTGNDSGPLAGLEFAVKDNIDVAGLPTTAGCPAFAYLAGAHATVVRKLLEAGASLRGKTNLDQFACGLNGTRSPWGAVPNAFDAHYVSGGSSSGSAYAVATGQVDFALGTDTAGSGRVPAGLNNIVGLKPSRGLISAAGVVPAAQSVDCVSIFARTVGLAARVLDAAHGPDAADPYSRTLALADQAFPADLRVGVPAELDFCGDAAAAQAFEVAIWLAQTLGARVTRIDYAPLAQAAGLLYDSALVAERLAAVRDFFDTNEADVMEPVRSIIASGRRYSAADYVDAQLRLRQLGQQAAEIWRGIDVLMVPTAPTHFTIDAMRADPIGLNRKLGLYTNFVNLLDYAALSVPASIRPDGLPFGVTFIGPCGSDWQLAEWGQRYHHATGLTQGACGASLPSPILIPGLKPEARVRVAVVGAHLSGMPLNWQLTQRGASLLTRTSTAPHYRLYALPDTQPPKPGLLRVPNASGARIEVEVWEMPVRDYGSFVAGIPGPLGIGTLELEGGEQVQGFVCEAIAVRGARDISHFGGWRSYMASLAAPAATAANA